MDFQPRLEEMERRYENLTAQMADPSVIADSAQYRKVTKAQSDMFEVVAKYREWKAAHENLQQARAMLADSDPELQAMAQEEIARMEPDASRSDAILERSRRSIKRRLGLGSDLKPVTTKTPQH